MIKIKQIIKKIVSSYRFFGIFFSIYLLFNIKKICSFKNKKNILILSFERWKVEVDELSKEKKFNYFSLKTRGIEVVNAFIKDLDDHKRVIYITNILKFLNFFFPVHATLTCSHVYKREFDWAKSFSKANIAFIVVHKEYNVLDPSRLKIKRYTSRKKTIIFFSVITYS